jgi:protein TonB
MDPQAIGGQLAESSEPARPAGTRYEPPELIMRIEPTYSRLAREARLQGTVQISATIGADGMPRSLSRVSGNAGLADMAIQALRQWRYKPALLNGQPVESQTIINMTFQLQ